MIQKNNIVTVIIAIAILSFLICGFVVFIILNPGLINFNAIKTTYIYISFGFLASALFLTIIYSYIFRKKVTQPEVQLKQPEVSVLSTQEEQVLVQNSVPVSSPLSEHKIDDIIEYIQKQKQIGVQGGPLVLLLRKAGYSDTEIQSAFSVINKVHY